MSRLAKDIDRVLTERGRTSFYDLAMILYPNPNSHRSAKHGGPPGCYMTLSAAIRQGGFPEVWKEPGPGNRWIFPRKSKT